MISTITVSKALIINTRGDMLVLRRSKTHPSMAGLLDLPGGIIEPNEGRAETVARETFEETSLDIPAKDFNLIYTGTHVHDGKNLVRLLFVTKLKDKQPKIKVSWEHDQANWVSTDELQNIETKFHPFYREALRYIEKHKLI